MPRVFYPREATGSNIKTLLSRDGSQSGMELQPHE